jgi:hypothetical protein
MWKLLYMFRVALPPIIRSVYNCIYSIWYLSHRYCYLTLLWKSWNRFERAVGGVRHPQHAQTGSNSSTIAADISNGVTNTRCCRYSCIRSWWWVELPPENVEQFPQINKLCNIVSCLDIYWNILTMHGPMNVKSPNNTSKWQMGFNSAFKGLIISSCLLFPASFSNFNLGEKSWKGKRAKFTLSHSVTRPLCRQFFCLFVSRHNRRTGTPPPPLPTIPPLLDSP